MGGSLCANVMPDHIFSGDPCGRRVQHLWNTASQPTRLTSSAQSIALLTRAWSAWSALKRMKRMKRIERRITPRRSGKQVVRRPARVELQGTWI